MVQTRLEPCGPGWEVWVLSAHNGSPLKGLVTVNREAHKGPREGSAQPPKPCIQDLTKHSLHCLCIVSMDSFHNSLSAPGFLALSLLGSLMALG